MVSPLTKKFERRSESIQREVRHIRRDSSLTKEEGSVFLAVVAAVTHSVSISVCPQHQQRVYEGLQTEFHHHPILIIIPILTFYIHSVFF